MERTEFDELIGVLTELSARARAAGLLRTSEALDDSVISVFNCFCADAGIRRAIASCGPIHLHSMN